MNATVKAYYNGRLVYSRHLKNYPSMESLELAINNSVNIDFKNFQCQIIQEVEK